MDGWRPTPSRRWRGRRWVIAGGLVPALLVLRSGVIRTAAGGRDLRIGALAWLRVAYPCGVIALMAGSLALAAACVAMRRKTGRKPRLMRCVALAASLTIAVVLAESAAGAYLAWIHRMPSLPRAGPGQKPDTGDVRIVVVGESSAEGVPYRDWLSVGKVVTWQLRRAIPWRMFHVEVQARPGWTLEQMHQRLVESRSRVDAVIIYAGHNEFASRFGWSSDVPYYLDEPVPIGETAAGLVARFLPLTRLLGEMLEKERVAAPPEPRPRSLVDVPSHTLADRSERLAEFGGRLEGMVSYCERVGALPVLVIPPGNDAGFEPSRSILPPETPGAEREAFARQVTAARELETSDPAASIDRYRGLIERQPGFAETHFRLARLLEARGDSEAAYRHYVAARDRDGHPMRCPSDFQEVFLEVARRHDVVLVDGQAVFHSRHPAGQLDDGLFNDAMHPSFEGHVALAEAILAGLKERGAFGWPAQTPAPRIDLAECAGHFDVQVATWSAACEFAASFYRTAVPIRFDPAERRDKAEQYAKALQRLMVDRADDGLAVPGVGLGSKVERIRH
jgi:lysophospholipase L1-like esterase